jgi:hypothetical protein
MKSIEGIKFRKAGGRNTSGGIKKWEQAISGYFPIFQLFIILGKNAKSLKGWKIGKGRGKM